MKAASYIQLIERMADIDAPPEIKRQYEEIVRRQAVLDGVKALERRERVQHARHLVEQGLDRSLISERLQAAYDIGKTVAQEDITKALQLGRFFRQKPDSGAI